jgi:hypothetical protein
MVTMYGAISEFESGPLLVRQREGVKKAQFDGKRKVCGTDTGPNDGEER